MALPVVRILAGSAVAHLAPGVCRALGVPDDTARMRRFPDGEMDVHVAADARGADAFILQSTGQPVGENVLELALLSDAAARAGAARISAFITYLGYARQDRRRHEGQPLGARVMARMIDATSIQRLLMLDLHSPPLEGVFDVPVDHLTAVPLLADAIRQSVHDDSIIVSPDLGGVKLAEHYAALLSRPLAIVHKTRMDGATVIAHDVVGDVRGRRPIIVDDMISTGGTVVEAVKALRQRGALDDITVVATHGLFNGDALQKLRAAAVARILTTDSVAPAARGMEAVRTVCLAPAIAALIQTLHDGKSIEGLLSRR